MAVPSDSDERQEMWNRDVFDRHGNLLGRVEAVGMSRDRTVRRVGVRARGTDPALRFIRVSQLVVDGDHLIFDPDAGD
jgi:hypothetical protein